MVHKSNIFYLYKDTPLQDNILDMENLKLNQKSDQPDSQVAQRGRLAAVDYKRGPFPVQGSNELFMIYLDYKTQKSCA